MVDLAGRWRLAAYYNIDDDTLSEGPLGPNPRGILYYGSDGYVSVSMGRPDAAPGQTAYLGYAGSWRRDGDTVIHHIEVCSNPAWTDTDQVRQLHQVRQTPHGRLLTLIGTSLVDGRPQRRLLEWHRETSGGARTDGMPDTPEPERATMFGTFGVITLRVKNLPEMTTFYRDVLGLEIKKQGAEFSAFHTGNGGELVLWTGSPVPMLPGFAGADLQAARAALINSSPSANPTEIQEHPGGKHFYAFDPDGNMIGFADA